MNIVRRELRAHLKSLLIWSISMVFLVFVGMIKYSGFAKSGEAAMDMINNLPRALRIVFGFDSLDITSVGGYFGVFFLYFILIGTIHAVMLGAVIISKEERDQTADFLFVKPISREKIVTSKLIAAFINIVVFNLTTLVSSLIFVGIYNQGESINGEIIRLMVPLFILQLVFLSIGAGISALTRSTKKATSLSTGVVLSTFILSVAIDMYDKIDFLKCITPFKYFEAKNIMFGGHLDGIYVALSALIVIGFTALTYVGYKRRDIHI